MSAFLGIGLGPIQSGIFLSGAEGRFDRLIVAEVDAECVEAVRASGSRISINIACDDGIKKRTISGIEIFNPLDDRDLGKLIDAASDADEICTALPSVAFYQKIIPWMAAALIRFPKRRRFVYAAENHNHAAEIFSERLGVRLERTFFLNTVIGKMCKVASGEECLRHKLTPLAEGLSKAHLVEAFDRILISGCPGIEERKVTGLWVKDDLLPFEEAKLYGHNAVHFLLGLHAAQAGVSFMHDLSGRPDITSRGMRAFLEESGAALLKKWRGAKDFFTEASFREYAEDLLRRMLNPFLMDSVGRVCRDPARKLGWDDRLIGTIRLCLSQDVPCPEFCLAARMAAAKFAPGATQDALRGRLKSLWGDVPDSEAESVLDAIFKG